MMSRLISICGCRGFCAIAALLLFFPAGNARAGENNKSPRSVAHRQAVAHAKQLAIQGDIDGAERALEADTVLEHKTAPAYFELAQRMTGIAGNLSRAGNAPASHLAAVRALRLLDKADQLATDTNLKAGIREQVGFLQERFFADIESAKTAYRAAVQLLPDSAAAKERLRRIEDSDASAKRKANR